MWGASCPAAVLKAASGKRHRHLFATSWQQTWKRQAVLQSLQHFLGPFPQLRPAAAFAAIWRLGGIRGELGQFLYLYEFSKAAVSPPQGQALHEGAQSAPRTFWGCHGPCDQWPEERTWGKERRVGSYYLLDASSWSAWQGGPMFWNS